MAEQAAPATGKSTKLWGARFTRDADVRIRKWTESVTIDTHLAREDMWGSIAHATMLGRQGIIPANAAGKIAHELEKLLGEFEVGTWALGHEQEDVHMNVEKTMITRLGMDIGGRMHTWFAHAELQFHCAHPRQPLAQRPGRAGLEAVCPQAPAGAARARAERRGCLHQACGAAH